MPFCESSYQTPFVPLGPAPCTRSQTIGTVLPAEVEAVGKSLTMVRSLPSGATRPIIASPVPPLEKNHRRLESVPAASGPGASAHSAPLNFCPSVSPGTDNEIHVG